MKAALYERYGDASVVRVVDVADEPPARGEVRIEVKAAALNPKDVMVRKGKYRWLSGSRFPKRPGLDVAGLVRDVGAGVSPSLKDKRVLGMLDGFCALAGTFADHVNVPAAQVAAFGDGLSFDDAAALPLAGCTALQALRDAGRLRPGDRVCIVGAAGGVGTLAVSIARLLGAHVTAVGSARSVEMLRSLGADVVLDRDRDDPFSGRRYDLVLDAFGKTRLARARRSLDRGGRYVSIVPSSGLVVDLVSAPLFGLRARTVVVRPLARDLEWLVTRAETGALVPVIDSAFALTDVEAAMRRLETRGAHGKIIVRPT